VTNSGKLFHACGPATAKALSPSDERRVAGTTRADDDADRSRRRDVTSATGCVATLSTYIRIVVWPVGIRRRYTSKAIDSGTSAVAAL